MKSVSIGEIASLKYGRMPPKEVLADDGYPVFSGYRITGYAKECTHKEPVLIVVARGVGGTGDVKISPPQSWITNLSIVLGLDETRVDRQFLFYKLQREPLKDRLNTGAAQAQITIANLAPYQIELPDLKTQKRIAESIRVYDDLIANNHRRIELLEQSARLLFKEWFVHLRYPGHEHDKIVDGVPEGWQRTKLRDVTALISRGITPKYDDDAEGVVINQKCIRNRLLDLKLVRRQSKEVPVDKVVRKGDVLINSTGDGTLGRVVQAIEIPDNCTVDSHITIVRPVEALQQTFFGLSITRLEDYLAKQGRGATNQTELARRTIAEIEIQIPPEQIRAAFEELVGPVFRQISILRRQEAKLAKARDLLLPRLMDGRTSV